MAKEIKICPSCGSDKVNFFPGGGLHCSACDSNFTISEKGKAKPVDREQISKDHERLGQVEKDITEIKEKEPAHVESEDDFDTMDDSGGFIEFD